jgi:hypothetical protein
MESNFASKRFISSDSVWGLLIQTTATYLYEVNSILLHFTQVDLQ